MIQGEVLSVESSEPVKRTVKTIELSLRAKKAIAATAEPKSFEPLVRSKSRSLLRRALARGVKERNGETAMLTGKRFAGETGPPQPEPEKLDLKMQGIRAPCSPERLRTVHANRASILRSGRAGDGDCFSEPETNCFRILRKSVGKSRQRKSEE